MTLQSSPEKAAVPASSSSASSASVEEETQLKLTVAEGVDALHELTSASASGASSPLPAFSLSPHSPSPPPSPPSSPSSFSPAVVAVLSELQQLLATSPFPTVSYSALLSRLLHHLTLPSTSTPFRCCVVRLLSLLLLPPAAPSSASAAAASFSSHLYRLISLLLPKSSFSATLTSATSSLLFSLATSPQQLFPRHTLSNVSRHVATYREEGERRRRQQATSPSSPPPLAYFAEGGAAPPASAAAAPPHPARRAEAEQEAAADWLWDGRRRRRILPEGENARGWTSIVTDEAEDKRATAMIERMRAEQKKQQAEQRLRPVGMPETEEWIATWREEKEEEDRETTVEEQDGSAGAAAAEGAEAVRKRRQRFWSSWFQAREWTPFLPSSQNAGEADDGKRSDSRRSSRTRESDERKDSRERTGDASQPQPQRTVSRSSTGFASVYLPPPAAAAHPARPPHAASLPAPASGHFTSHYIHPSRLGSVAAGASLRRPDVPPPAIAPPALGFFAPVHAQR